MAYQDSIYCVNLHTILSKDFIKDVISKNSDQTINVKYTLSAIKEKLYDDIKSINKLLEYSKKIENMIVDAESETIIVEIYDATTIEELVGGGILGEEYNDFSDSDDTEKDRLQMLTNIITTSDLNNKNAKFESDSGSDSVSEELFDEDY